MKFVVWKHRYTDALDEWWTVPDDPKYVHTNRKDAERVASDMACFQLSITNVRVTLEEGPIPKLGPGRTWHVVPRYRRFSLRENRRVPLRRATIRKTRKTW